MGYLVGSIAGQFSRSLARLSKMLGAPAEPIALLPAAASEVPPTPIAPSHPYGPHLRVLIQGLDCPLGASCAARMRAYGTPAMAGVAAGLAGTVREELPIFDLVESVRAEVGPIDASLIATEPFSVLDAGFEAIAAGISQLIVLTPEVPPLDMMQLLQKAETANARVLGAGSRGIIAPGRVLLGNYATEFYRPGSIGIVSSVGCLTDEVAIALADMGQSLAVNLGTEEILASSYEPWLEVLSQDEGTTAIVLVARADRDDLEAVADYIAADCNKPVVAYLVGQETRASQDCLGALQDAGAQIVGRPSQVPPALITACRTFQTSIANVSTTDGR